MTDSQKLIYYVSYTAYLESTLKDVANGAIPGIIKMDEREVRRFIDKSIADAKAYATRISTPGER